MQESLGHLAHVYSKHGTRLRWEAGLDMVRNSFKAPFYLTKRERRELLEALLECQRREQEAQGA